MTIRNRHDKVARTRGYSVCVCVLALAALLLFGVAPALSPRADAALYWPDGYGLARANMDGSEFEHPFISPGPPNSPVLYDAGCSAVAVDASHVYWSQPDRGAIGRANLDGSGVEYDFLSGLENPCGVAVDGTSIYWAEEGAGRSARLTSTGAMPIGASSVG